MPSRNSLHIVAVYLIAGLLIGVVIGRVSTWGNTNRLQQRNSQQADQITYFKSAKYQQTLKDKIANLEARIYVHLAATEVISEQVKILRKERDDALYQRDTAVRTVDALFRSLQVESRRRQKTHQK